MTCFQFVAYWPVALFIFWFMPQEYFTKYRIFVYYDLHIWCCFSFSLTWSVTHRYSLVYTLAYTSGSSQKILQNISMLNMFTFDVFSVLHSLGQSVSHGYILVYILAHTSETELFTENFIGYRVFVLLFCIAVCIPLGDCLSSFIPWGVRLYTFRYLSVRLYTFSPLLKKSSGNPYLKIPDFTKLFVADVPMKKKSKFSFTSSHCTFETLKNIVLR